MEEIKERYTMPLIGDKAPSFIATTTQGKSIFLKILKENG